MTVCEELLRRIRTQPPSEASQLAERWLSPRETRLIGSGPTETTVSAASSLWRLRLTNLLEKGDRLEGAESFLLRLSKLNPVKKLVQFSFTNEASTGSVFFEKASGHFVGIVVRDLGHTRAPKEYEHDVQFA